MKKRLTALFCALLLAIISVMSTGCAPDLSPNSGSGSSNLSDSESSSIEDNSSESSDGESSSIEDSSSEEEESSSSEKKDDLGSDEYENDGGWMN